MSTVPSHPPSLPRTWRPRAGLVVAILVGTGLVVTALGMWFLMPAEMREAFSLFQALTLLLILLALLVGLYGVGRTRLSADEDGVTIVNAFRTHRLAWPQVLRVSLRSGDPWVVLDVDDGTAVSVMALQAADGGRTRTAVSQLRALVEERSRTDRND